MTINIDQLVQREVKYNVSQLIDKLAYDYNDDELIDLYRGPLNYEDAASDAGWYINEGGNFETVFGCDIPDEITTFGPTDPDGGWSTLCSAEDIEPYETEVFEHWIVSDWLADKLIAKGETVVKDYMGLTIWGRTTSGQAISLDYVIQQIYQELVK